MVIFKRNWKLFIKVYLVGEIMNKYKFKFGKLTIGLMLVGIVVAILCLVLNIIRFLNLINGNFELSLYNYLTLIITATLSIGFIVIVLCAYFNSYYKITDKNLILRFGIIKNEFNLTDIKEVRLLTQKSKLELLFKDESYFIVSTNANWFETFVDEIKEKCPKIEFVQFSEEENK